MSELAAAAGSAIAWADPAGREYVFKPLTRGQAAELVARWDEADRRQLINTLETAQAEPEHRVALLREFDDRAGTVSRAVSTLVRLDRITDTLQVCHESGGLAHLLLDGNGLMELALQLWGIEPAGDVEGGEPPKKPVMGGNGTG